MKSAQLKIDINSGTVVLSAILLSGLFLRLYNLGGQSLWLDEVLSVKYANLNLSQVVLLNDTTPPLYYILLHWWIHLFGVSEFSLRFPSVLCGFFSIIMMYETGKQLHNVNTGKIGALLMAFSVCHIQYSQEARTYSLSVLLTLLSMYFFLNLLKRRSRGILLGYVVSSLLLIYSHVYGLFIIIAQNIYFIALSLLSGETGKPGVKKWFLIQSLLVLLFIPWMSVFVHEAAQVQNGFWIPRPHISAVISSFRMYSSGSGFLLLVFLAVLPFLFISYEKLRGGTDERSFFRFLESYEWKIHLLNIDMLCFLIMWLMTPLILPFIISRFSQPIFIARYTIIASSAFFLLVAGGISNVRSKPVRSIVISIVIILSLRSVAGYYMEPDKEQWREVAEYVDTNANKSDVVLVTPAYYLDPFNYYDRKALPVRKGFPEDGRKLIDERDIIQLSKTVANYDRVWLISSDRGDKEEKIAGALGKSYNFLYHKEYKHIKLYFFEKGYRHAVSGRSDFKPYRRAGAG
jgi:mannosyltransferase